MSTKAMKWLIRFFDDHSMLWHFLWIIPLATAVAYVQTYVLK